MVEIYSAILRVDATVYKLITFFPFQLDVSKKEVTQRGRQKKEQK